MDARSYIFTSESVSEGHPDKVADQISDGILDACLREDPYSRVAIETLVKDNYVVIGGELTTKASPNYEQIARTVVKEIGYTDPKIGFSDSTLQVQSFVSKQSPDISMGVDEDIANKKEQGAGDQGLMFGFACDETPELMPLPISLAHQLVSELANVRHNGEVHFLRPDAKSQVSVEYKGDKPIGIKTVVISTQHTEDVSLKELGEFVVDRVIRKVLPAKFITPETKFLINPTGRFVVGGPVGDCGLTGRKIIVDTYGGYGRHGGGAFSGKDPSKVDRSACYAARHIAKNIVGAGLAKKCEVQVAYAIGVARPVSIYVNTFGTGCVKDDQIEAAVAEVFDLRPRGIIECLDLLRPIYRVTASLGHFGRHPTDKGEFTWERLDKVEALNSALGLAANKRCCNGA